jgi:hypothetical protein
MCGRRKGALSDTRRAHAAGGFTGTYNFGTQDGTFAINNFDGQNVTATGAARCAAASTL